MAASTSAVADAAAAAFTSTVTTVFMSRPRDVHRLLAAGTPGRHRGVTRVPYAPRTMTSTTPDPADHSSDRADRPHPDTTGTGTADAT
ncbi:hypothetical protein CXF36_03475, partial [Corynebacterium bovis]